MTSIVISVSTFSFIYLFLAMMGLHWASLVAQSIKHPPANARNLLHCRRSGFDPCIRKILRRRKWQLTLVFLPWKSLGQRRVFVSACGLFLAVVHRLLAVASLVAEHRL